MGSEMCIRDRPITIRRTPRERMRVNASTERVSPDTSIPCTGSMFKYTSYSPVSVVVSFFARDDDDDRTSRSFLSACSRTSHQLGQTETLRTGCLSFSSAQSRTRILGAARTRPRMSPPRRTRVRPIHRRLNRRSKRSKHCRGKRGGGELKTNVLVVVCVVYLDDDT